MTKVSKFPLRPDVYDRIFNLFVQTLVDIRDKRKLEAFVNDFFTPTERIMFVKRLAAAVFLAKGYSYGSIQRILRISSPTIAKMSFKVNYEGKGINPIIKDVFSKQARKILLEEIISLFDMPIKGSSPADRLKRKRKRKMRIDQLKNEF